MAEPAPQSIQTERSQEQTTSRGYLWLTRGIAVLLLFAAGMKAWQLATVPSLGEGLLHARWFNIVVVEFEIVFACWLLMGLLPKLTRWATIALFTTFAGVSLYKAVSGEASCGCFGAVTVNPWWTMGLDVVVVGLVVLHSHNQRVSCPWFDLAELDKRRLAWTVVVWLVMSIPTTFAMTSVKTNDLSELGTVFMGADGKETILLEPEKWKKGVFPLLPYIEPPEVREQLKTGTWTVVLYHHDCPKCKEVIEELAVKGEPNVVCVEVPPYGDKGFEVHKKLNFVYGILTSSEEWFVDTPLVMNVTKATQLRR